MKKPIEYQAKWRTNGTPRTSAINCLHDNKLEFQLLPYNSPSIHKHFSGLEKRHSRHLSQERVGSRVVRVGKRSPGNLGVNLLRGSRSIAQINLALSLAGGGRLASGVSLGLLRQIGGGGLDDVEGVLGVLLSKILGDVDLLIKEISDLSNLSINQLLVAEVDEGRKEGGRGC